MKTGRLYRITAFLLAAAAVLAAGSVRAWAAGGNLKDASFTEADRAQFFVAYIYIREDEENLYKDSTRDVTLHFGSYYITEKYADYAQTDLYKNFGVIRVHGYLPDTQTYFPSMEASDAVPLRFTYRVLHGDTEDSGNGVRLEEGNNEFFFLGGNTDYVLGEAGTKKLQELYGMCHTPDGGLYGNEAQEVILRREEYRELAEAMNEDASLEEITDFYGNTYTREDLRALGLAVVPGDAEKEEAPQEADSGETEEPSAIPAPSEEIGKADRVFHLSGLTIFLFLIPVFAAAGFVLYQAYRYCRARKDDENTYID